MPTYEGIGRQRDERVAGREQNDIAQQIAGDWEGRQDGRAGGRENRNSAAAKVGGQLRGTPCAEREREREAQQKKQSRTKQSAELEEGQELWGPFLTTLHCPGETLLNNKHFHQKPGHHTGVRTLELYAYSLGTTGDSGMGALQKRIQTRAKQRAVPKKNSKCEAPATG